MSFVYSLRSTLFYAVIATFMTWNGVRLYRHSADPELAVLVLAPAALLWVGLLDGIQRRWRGDERTHTSNPDPRTLASLIVSSAGLAVVGLWSFASGHRPMVWTILLGGGLIGVVAGLWVRQPLLRD